LFIAENVKRQKIQIMYIMIIKSITDKELWIDGRFDSVARKALESRGWKVRETKQNIE
jgi:hypothetical protein